MLRDEVNLEAMSIDGWSGLEGDVLRGYGAGYDGLANLAFEHLNGRRFVWRRCRNSSDENEPSQWFDAVVLERNSWGLRSILGGCGLDWVWLARAGS